MKVLAPAALAALLLASSLGAGAPPTAGVAPGQVWATALEQAEAAGVSVNLLGESFVAGAGLGGASLWKLDVHGEPLWVHRAPGFGGAVAAFPDSGAVWASNVLGPGVGADVLVRAVDAEGDVVWERVIGTADDDVVRAAAADGEGGWVAGSTGPDGLVAKLDADGTHRWSRRVATVGEDRFEAVAPFADGSVAVAGWSYDGVRNRMLLARLDAYGNTLWQRALTSDGASLRAYAASATPQGDLLVVGLRSNGVQQVPYLARFDGDGRLLWQRALEQQPGGFASGVASDVAGGAIVTGTVPAAGGQRDAFLVRLTPTGGIAWMHRHDTGGDDHARGVAWLPAGLFTLGGTGSGLLQAVRFMDLPVRPIT